MDVADWLRALGLERYEAAFRENAVNAELLPKLTAEDLKDLGVTLVGHRRQLLEAIAALRQDGTPAGDALPPATPAGPLAASDTTAERRPLSVMFCDLIGSTALSSRLDPEDLREVIRSYQARVASTIQQFNGFIARYVGDGVLIYFGWPAAHETDAGRAVRAGLAVAAAVSEAPVAGQTLQVRIGIATGLVVIGEPIGSGDARQQTAIGETPNRAARLQSLAGSNQVIIDAATRRQIGGLFDCRDLGTMTLKGLPEPVPAWQVVSENRALGQFEALRSGLTPLVGREEEIELLLRRWTQVKGGSGKVVLISAEPGVGKSRLAEVLAAQIASEPDIRLRWFCSPHHQDSALYPVIAQLERAAGFAHGDTPAVRLAKLQALLATTEPSLEDVTLIAAMHDLPIANLAPLDLTPQRRKEKTFQALLRHLEGLARQHPVLMLFDDLHWIDPSSRELLDRLLERVMDWPVLLLALFRPEFQPPWLGQPQVTVLNLARLGRQDATAMVGSLAGNMALPAEIVAEIAERSDGVPLFVEELTKAVLEAGAQAPTTLSATPHPALSVPPTLHASLMARLDRLGPVARDVAQTSAAIGREFGYDLLAAVTHLPDEGLCSALDALVATGLVRRRGEPPDAVYAFRHALIRDAAYGTMLRVRRRELHRDTANAIERLQPETLEREPEVLAHHRAEAGEAEAAVALYQRAGERSAARAAFREAQAHLARGTALLSDVEDGATAWRLEVGLLAALGSVAMMDAGHASSGAGWAFARAIELSRSIGDEALLARVLHGLWTHKLFAGDLARALPLVEEGVRLARRESEPDQWSRVRAALGMTHFPRGRSDLARPLLNEVLADLNAYDAGAGIFLSGGIIAQNSLMWQLAVGGELERAAAQTQEVPERARRTRHPTSLVICLATCCGVAWLIGDLVSLRDKTRELAEVTEAHGFSHYVARARIFEGWVAVVDGNVAEGINLIAVSLVAQQAPGNALYIPYQGAMLADAQLSAGNAVAALAQVEEALRLSTRTGEAWFDAELHRRVGSILLHLGHPDDTARAEGEFMCALEIARSQSALLFELRAACAVAQLWRDQGHLAEARGLLAPVYQSFTEGFEFPDLVAARMLLEELDSVSACGVIDADGSESRKGMLS